MDRNKILKMIVILAAVVVIATTFSKFMQHGSMSLSEYARLQGIQESQSDDAFPEPPKNSSAESLADGSESTFPSPGTSAETVAPDFQPDITESPKQESYGQQTAPHPEETEEPLPSPSLLTGASLNGNSQLDQRFTLETDFYYEPLSAQLCRYITGISYPASDSEKTMAEPEITLDELRYVHILHYDFEGNAAEGELICNEYIAQDLVEIFYELYRNEYQLEKVLLIDEYDGDDDASMEDNNTSCFNYRQVTGSSSLSKHALGLAVDINPLYNPYITYGDNGEENVLPVSASPYTDRSTAFPYKIDENDLCYKLFTQHGFTWGGNWNNIKDYQHFQKVKKE